jgi:hypothetical protein
MGARLTHGTTRARENSVKTYVRQNPTAVGLQPIQNASFLNHSLRARQNFRKKLYVRQNRGSRLRHHNH